MREVLVSDHIDFFPIIWHLHLLSRIKLEILSCCSRLWNIQDQTWQLWQVTHTRYVWIKQKKLSFIQERSSVNGSFFGGGGGLCTQNVISRVASLPLVSSTYDMVSVAYVNTKGSHPYLKSVCEIAEKGVKTITAVAITTALPIIQRLEPQSKTNSLFYIFVLFLLTAFAFHSVRFFRLLHMVLRHLLVSHT